MHQDQELSAIRDGRHKVNRGRVARRRTLMVGSSLVLLGSLAFAGATDNLGTWVWALYWPSRTDHAKTRVGVRPVTQSGEPPTSHANHHKPSRRTAA